MDATSPPPESLASAAAGYERLVPHERNMRAVHQAVLRSFAATGRPPAPRSLAGIAAPFETAAVLSGLVELDHLCLDEAGLITVAYPFSTARTPHLVELGNGVSAYAMCAIDALGIAPMLREPILISSLDARTGEPISVSLDASGDGQWRPASAVVFVGQAADSCACSSAETCCGFMNFFVNRRSARSWAGMHPEISGRILSQRRAIELGRVIFGRMLS
jgi:hypothetical protein